MGQNLPITNQNHAFYPIGIDTIAGTEFQAGKRFSGSEAKGSSSFMPQNESHGGGTEGTLPVKEENGIWKISSLSCGKSHNYPRISFAVIR